MSEGVHYLNASAPEGMRLYAVGDIHGRHDLLAAMHGHIMEEILADRPLDWRIIYVGDYVDRGPESRGVLEFLSRTCEKEPRVIALAGNHDIGFLEFLANPDPDGLFANNGGFETGLSYGVTLEFGSRRALLSGHAALLEAMPDRHLRFLRSLPYSVEFGDFFFCHAGIRPGVALGAQSPHDLIWIRQSFHDHAGLYPKVIVHGHTPVDHAEIRPNRVNLDTGAWYSNRLTALVIEGDDKQLLEAAV